MDGHTSYTLDIETAVSKLDSGGGLVSKNSANTKKEEKREKKKKKEKRTIRWFLAGSLIYSVRFILMRTHVYVYVYMSLHKSTCARNRDHLWEKVRQFDDQSVNQSIDRSINRLPE